MTTLVECEALTSVCARAVRNRPGNLIKSPMSPSRTAPGESESRRPFPLTLIYPLARLTLR